MDNYSYISELTKPNEYELTTTPITATDRPTSTTTSCVKKEKNNTWLFCLTAGCVINFVLGILTISLLAYHLSNYTATRSEVTRISQELQVSEKFSGSNGSSFGCPGPMGPPGPSGLPGTPGRTSCLIQQEYIYNEDIVLIS